MYKLSIMEDISNNGWKALFINESFSILLGDAAQYFCDLFIYGI